MLIGQARTEGLTLITVGVGHLDGGWRVNMLVAGLDIRILGIDCSPLRHLTLDPSVDDYQRIP